MTLFGGDRSVAVRLLLDPKGYAAGLAVAKKSTQDFARAGIESAGKNKRSFDELGRGAIGAGLVIGGLAATAVVSFAKFDKSMSRAQAGTQATASQMTLLRAAAIKAGADTQYSATEAADAITAMGKAGVSVQNILSGGLRGAMDLAAAGELSVADAADIAATTMNQFALKGSEVGHVADVLAAGAGKAQGSVKDLSEALKFVGPVAHASGISLDQTVGTLAEFASQGIIGEQAGTSLRGVILSLQGPSKKAADTMASLGISLYDAHGKFVGIDGAANELQKGLSGLTDAQKDATLATIFGNEQITAARILYQGGAAAVQEWQHKVNDAGFASRQAGQLMNNLAGDVEMLKGSLETTLISSGAGANEGLRSLTKGATGTVNAFGALPDPLQKDIILFGGLTAGALLLGGGILIMAARIKSAKVAMGELGISTERTRKSALLAGKAFGAFAILSTLPDLGNSLDEKLGSVPSDLDALSQSLENLSRTGHATGELSKAFGADFEGASSWARSWSGQTESLGEAVDRLSQKHGALGRFLRWDPTGDSSAKGIKDIGESLASLVASGDQDAASDAFNVMAQKAGLTGEATGKLLDLMPAYRDALVQQKKASGDATHSVLELAQGEQTAAQSAAAAADANKTYAESLLALSHGLSDESAQSDYQAAIDDLTKSLKENGHATDITTEKGRNNREAMRAVAAQGKAYAKQIFESTGSNDKFADIIETTRKALIKQGTILFGTKKKAEEYANKLLGTPKEIETQVRLDGAVDAIAKLKEFIRQAKIAGRLTLSVGVTTIPTSLLKNQHGITPANGGLIHPYANGGMEVHNAQIAKGGAYRLWAEPETGGEAYIPLAPSKRTRSKEILKTTAGLLGMTAFAEGGFSRSSPFSVADSLSRYADSRLEPITKKQYDAAIAARTAAHNRTKNATQAVDKAERDLAYERRHHPRNVNAIKDAEAKLDKARRAEAAARSNEAAKVSQAKSAVARKNAPKGFSLGDYTKSLSKTVATTERYRTQLAAIAKRGGQPLADLLEGMGAEGGPLINALSRANAKDFKKVVDLLKRLDPSAFSDGLTYKQFAAGGVETHIAQYGGGGMRLWNEPETGGEAYIPLAPGKQVRSRMLASDVVTRLGGAVAWSTDRARSSSVSAAISGSATAGHSGPLLNVGKIDLIRGGPEDVATDLMFSLRSRGL